MAGPIPEAGVLSQLCNVRCFALPIISMLQVQLRVHPRCQRMLNQYLASSRQIHRKSHSPPGLSNYGGTVLRAKPGCCGLQTLRCCLTENTLSKWGCSTWLRAGRLGRPADITGSIVEHLDGAGAFLKMIQEQLPWFVSFEG